MEQDGRPLRVLFVVPAWPHADRPVSGTYLRRHAVAIAKYCKVWVVHIEEHDVSHESLHVDVTCEADGDLAVARAKFSAAKSLVSRTITPNLLRPVHALRQAMRALGVSGVDIVHGNMTRGAGFAALCVARALRVPFVLTEHFSGMLLTDVKPLDLSQRAFVQFVLRSAAAVTGVSQGLVDALRAQVPRQRFEVIHNVAYPMATTVGRPPLARPIPIVHVSLMLDDAKNVSGLLRATRRLADRRDDFRLHLIGSGRDEPRLRALAVELGLGDRIVFEGLLREQELLPHLADFAFLVMFSNYETFCVVLAEAISTGIPVVTTEIAGPRDFVCAEVGVTVPPRDEAALADAMDWMLDHYVYFRPEQLRAYGQKRFATDRIGRQFLELYRSVLASASK